MKSFLIIQLLRSFSKNEIIQFVEFLRSPFYNKKPNAVKFFEVLKKHAPDFNGVSIQKENIWKEMYPNKNYNWGILKNLIFDISKLSEKFIEVVQYEKNTVEKKFFYLDALSNRKAHSKFFSEYSSLLKKIEKSKFYQNYYSDIQKLKTKKYNHCGIYTNYQSEVENEIIEISDYFMFDVILKLSGMYSESVCMLTSKNKSKRKNLAEYFFNEIDIKKILSSEDLSDKDRNILSLYHSKYLSFAFPENEENYYDYKKNLYESSDLFSQEEKYDLYNYLHSALNHKSPRKVTNKLREFLEIYKKQIDENVFTDPSGGINVYAYTNIIKMAARALDHKLIKFAMDNYFDLLLPEFKKNMISFSEAFYNFTKGNYEKALEHTMMIRLDHFIFRFDIKDLQAMLYYELEDQDSFKYLMDTFSHFLKKNKSVSDNHKFWYNVFISNLYRLFKIKINFDEYELIKFEKDVQEGKTGSIAYFTIKISELKKLHKIN